MKTHGKMRAKPIAKANGDDDFRSFYDSSEQEHLHYP